MNSTTVAIFGHYDSRGGAVAIRLPNKPTQADLDRAFSQYDVDFGYDESEGYPRPSVTDFMEVAVIHHNGDLPDGELLWDYADGEQGGILVREYTEQDAEEERREAEYRSLSKEEREEQHQREHAEYEAKFEATHGADWWDLSHEEQQRRGDEINAREAQEALKQNLKTLDNPLQLEYIPADAEWQAKHEAIFPKYAEMRQREGLINGWDSAWTPGQAAKAEQIREWEHAEYERVHQELASRAKVIKKPVITNYGEDACGLILISPENDDTGIDDYIDGGNAAHDFTEF